MASTSVADYQVLRDGAVTLQRNFGNSPGVPERLHEDFVVPSDINKSTSGARKAIFAFKIRPDQDSEFRIVFNGVVVLDASLDKSHTRTFWETFDIGSAVDHAPLQNGKAPVQIIMDTGRAVFSDIIVWYQINR